MSWRAKEAYSLFYKGNQRSIKDIKHVEIFWCYFNILTFNLALKGVGNVESIVQRVTILIARGPLINHHHPENNAKTLRVS